MSCVLSILSAGLGPLRLCDRLDPPQRRWFAVKVCEISKMLWHSAGGRHRKGIYYTLHYSIHYISLYWTTSSLAYGHSYTQSSPYVAFCMGISVWFMSVWGLCCCVCLQPSPSRGYPGACVALIWRKDDRVGRMYAGLYTFWYLRILRYQTSTAVPVGRLARITSVWLLLVREYSV